MRIISGSLRGKHIDFPKGGGTRPMTDEMREAVFNILGPIDGLSVLDVYAGSGGIGLEALSRGGTSVVAIEKSRKAADTIRKNVQNLGLTDQYQLQQQTVEEWLKKQGNVAGKYDLIFADPPFDDFNEDAVKALTPLLQPRGLLMVRTKSRRALLEFPDMEIAKSRPSGRSVISFYRFVK